MTEKQPIVKTLRIYDSIDPDRTLTGEDVINQDMCNQSVERGLMKLIDIVNYNAEVLKKLIKKLNIDLDSMEEQHD